MMWRVGTVVALQDETATARTITLKVPDWPGHIAGQHVDVRLTASDGYSAVRSYSIASAPNAEKRVELTVERLPNGEVSPYLTQEIAVSDRLELRGPIGGWFVWRAQQTEPIQLVAGGSGIVPLMAMIRSRASTGSTAPFRLLYSVLFFSSRIRHTKFDCDWSSDVCSSDLNSLNEQQQVTFLERIAHLVHQPFVERRIGAMNARRVEEDDLRFGCRDHALDRCPRGLRQIGRASCRERV